MSRYVDHKHGLVVGSDNFFFYRKSEDVFLDHWRSIVWAKNYDLDVISTVSVKIRTPAQQVIWKGVDPIEISTHIKMWLEREVGEFEKDWGVRPLPERYADCIFFSGRMKALKFVHHVSDILRGIRLP